MAALLPANPGEALWIGGTNGKNHYNVGIGLGSSGGNNHEDFGQDLISEGFVYSTAGGTSPYNDADKFYLNSTGNPVFRINAGAGRTSSNTAHPRCELRELTLAGASAKWDGRSGVHYVKGRCRIIDVTTNRPWVCFAQIHGSPNSPNTSDLIRLQTEGTNGTSTNLSIVSRRTPPGGSEIRTVLRTGYDVNDWFSYELGMYEGRLKVFLDGVAVLDVTGMGQIDNYFKAGCYLQDNVEKGASASDFAAVEYERGSFVTWHSGYANPTLPVFTGASDPEGGPGGGDGGPDTQAPTVPQDLVSLQDDEAITLLWSPSTDNVGVDHYNIYRFSDSGTGGGEGSTATVGKTEGGASSTSSSTDKMVASRHLADADGTLTEGHFRAWLSAAGTTNSKMFVYADSSEAPGALLATSDQIAITETAEGVQDYTFTGAEQISITDGTAYWIAVAWDDPGSISITYSRDGTASQRVEQTLTYPTAPDPFGTPTGTFTGPIDAWVETVSAGTGGGTDTTLGKLTNGASSSTSSTDKVAVSSFTASGDGTLTTGGARVWMSAGSTLCRMVVVADTAGAPGNFLAVSDQVTLSATSEAEVAFTFSGASQISITNGTTYWVGVAWDDPGTDSLTISRDNTGSQRQETTTFTYPPTVGAAFGTPSAQSGPMDAYVNVTASAGYVLLGTTTFATYTDTGLTNGTEYTYVVSASDAAGNSSAQSTPVSDTPGPPDTTAPSVPADLAAVAGDRRVTLSWTASTDADSGVDVYRVYRDSVQVAEIDADEAVSYVDTGVVNGTLYSYTVSAVDVAGNESAESAADTATPAAPAIAGAPWLIGELGADAKVGVEIAWGAELGNDEASWVWTDITADVRHEPGISTSLGRADESSTSNPASLSLVLDNTDGDYSLGGHSANWPYVRRNTPVRVRIDPDDGAGGRVLFLGFADGFTPGWARHNVPIVTLSASGTLRRLTQGDAPVQSSYRRVMTATSSVQAYWPFEEGKDAEYAPAVRGGADMTIVPNSGFRDGPTGFGDPGWGQDDSFDCSAPLPLLRTGGFLAAVYPYADTGSQQIRFLMSVPDDGLPDGTTIIHIHAGTCQWGLTYEANTTTGGSSLGIFRKVNGIEHSSSQVAFDVNGRSGRLTLQLTQSGSDIVWRLDYLSANADRGGTTSSVVGSFYGETLTGVTGGIVSFIEVNPHGHIGDMGFGHLTVENALNSLFTDSRALFAHRRDSPTAVGGRLDRLATENGIPLTVHGSPVLELGTIFSQMGSQLVAPLLTLLREAETFDQGQLWDGRAAGLSYTTRRRREDGTVRLSIDASAGELAAGFDAVDDDQRTRNRVVVSRLFGVTSMAEDADGPLGTETIGVYDTSYTVNASAEGMALQHAQWAVHLGTVGGYRYPSVTLNLRKVPHLAAEVLDIIPGERIDVTNLDDALDQFPGGTVSLIVEGISHELSASSWTVTFQCSPFSPWGVGRVAEETGDTSDVLMRLDTDGATLNGAASAGATSISVATAAGAALWSTVADDYPLALSVGGLYVRATACSGASSPQTFTVDALTHARADGVEVALWDPRPVGLG